MINFGPFIFGLEAAITFLVAFKFLPLLFKFIISKNKKVFISQLSVNTIFKRLLLGSKDWVMASLFTNILFGLGIVIGTVIAPGNLFSLSTSYSNISLVFTGDDTVFGLVCGCLVVLNLYAFILMIISSISGPKFAIYINSFNVCIWIFVAFLFISVSPLTILWVVITPIFMSIVGFIKGLQLDYRADKKSNINK